MSVTRKRPIKTNKRITLKKINVSIIEKAENFGLETINDKKIIENKSPIQERMKKGEASTKEKIELFREKGITILEELSEDELISMLKMANEYYYNKEPLLSDNTFDILKEHMEKKYPQNVLIKEVGSEIKKNKVTLPYYMGSMDKIKPDTKALENWCKKYKGGYVLSCKLDGISGLYSTEGEEAKLYTRGNGKVGQDISYLIPYLNLPKEKGLVVRGELIMLRKRFEDIYKGQFANARNMVSGLVNSKTVDDKIKDVDFVSYEVIKPELKISEQMKKMEESGFKTVRNEKVEKLSNEYLSNKLIDWRTNYAYEIDGVIVADDNIYKRKEKNPEHAFAFKMVISDQIAEAKVVDVIWTPSKSGFLKPKVRIEQINLGGVKIEYATGFNGSFIENNKIGIGAKIQLIRSGDVIPHIREVIEQADEAKMPNVNYHWNESHVDIILDNMEEDNTVKEKNITAFFTTLGVEGLSSGNVKRIMNAGYDSIAKVILMKKTDFNGIEGFKTKMIEKIYGGIQEKVKNANIVDIMVASNMFGRGLGRKKIEPIMEKYPNILTSNEKYEEKVEMLKTVTNIGKENAKSFASNINIFMNFLKEAELEYKMNEKVEKKEEIKESGHILSNKNVVMTKVRDKEIIEKLNEVGGKLVDSINKNTFVLIVKNKEDESNKTKKAKELNIAIMEVDEFKKKYM
jgi:DNA ligase (NAD+)